MGSFKVLLVALLDKHYFHDQNLKSKARVQYSYVLVCVWLAKKTKFQLNILLPGSTKTRPNTYSYTTCSFKKRLCYFLLCTVFRCRESHDQNIWNITYLWEDRSILYWKRIQWQTDSHNKEHFNTVYWFFVVMFAITWNNTCLNLKPSTTHLIRFI